MLCEVILPRNKIKGEITARYIYQTLSIDAKILVALGVPSVQLFNILMLTNQINILIISLSSEKMKAFKVKMQQSHKLMLPIP